MVLRTCIFERGAASCKNLHSSSNSPLTRLLGICMLSDQQEIKLYSRGRLTTSHKCSRPVSENHTATITSHNDFTSSSEDTPEIQGTKRGARHLCAARNTRLAVSICYLANSSVVRKTTEYKTCDPQEHSQLVSRELSAWFAWSTEEASLKKHRN